MKKLMFTLATVVTLLMACMPAYAGFQGINGVTNLGIFNKLTCSTGLTCTKVRDAFSIVSSPTISTGALTVLAGSGVAGTMDLKANNNAVNGDDWQLKSTTSEGGLQILNNVSGSLAQKLLLDTSGNLTASGLGTFTGGLSGGTVPRTRYHGWVPQPVSNATSVTGLTTSVYLTQVSIPYSFTVTGVGVLNAATVGTNKWIVALFNASGTVVANSATAGVTTAGASAFQQIPFTATANLIGPGTYWVGLYVNGTTDTYYSIPTLGQSDSLAGSVGSQTFGTVANVTLPTTFTAGVAPVVYIY